MKRFLLYAFVILSLAIFSTQAVLADATAMIKVNGADVTTINGVAPFTVEFDGSGSTPDNLNYIWSGDVDSTTETFSETFDTADTYTVNLFVSEVGNETSNATDSVSIVVADPNTAFTMTGDTISVIQGSAQAASITVANTGNVPTTVALTETSSDAFTVAFSDSTADLAVDESQEIAITVTAAADAPVGQSTITITGTDGDVEVTSTITVTVVAMPTQPGLSFNLNTINLGDDDAERGDTVEAEVVLTNTGSQPLENIVLTTSANDDYEVTFNPSTIAALDLLGTQTITVTVEIPEDQNSGIDGIGKITASATVVGEATIVTDSADLDLETRTELLIDEIEVTLKEQDKDENLDDGEDFDAQPGEEVELKIFVKNRYSDDVEIQDIEVEVEGESDLDVDEKEDFGDLNDGKDDDVTITFTVDRDLDDEDEFDIDITVTGEDENGAEHEDTWTITLIVERKNHFISIEEADLSPESVSCQLSARIDVLVENLGADDEDRVTIQVDSDDLDYTKAIKNIELDTDDDVERIFTISWDEPLSKGDYFIDVETFYDTSRRSDIETLQLTAVGCSDDEDDDADNDDDIFVEDDDFDFGNTDNQGNTGTTGNVVFVDQNEKSNFTGTAYIILLVLAALLVIVIIIVLLKKFLF